MAANSYSQTRRLEDAAYNDSPLLSWDENFDLEGFHSSIETFNNQETKAFLNTFHWYTDLSHYLSIEDQLRTEGKINALRVTCTNEVAKIFDESHDLIFPLIIDKQLLHFINRVMQGVLDEDLKSLDSPEVLCLWCLNHISNWQMMEPQTDEIREILWYFQHSNQLVDRKQAMYFDGSNGIRCAFDNDRRVYSTPQNNLKAFAKWVSVPIFKPKAFSHVV
ncbi:hypothetical protein F5146DRAFT_1141914 [Armillaria mellea]|nr:hypothetical protein F5146DRAFT_1141914 [Armillaria mellea]